MTTDYQVDNRLIFSREDHAEARITSRWKVEQEKLHELFPNAVLLSTGARPIERVRFTVNTRFDTHRAIFLDIPANYPNGIPRAFGDGWNPEEREVGDEFQHIYPDHRLCIQDDNQWSRDGSIALALARTAKWVDKYEMWLRSGGPGSRRWPGSQHRGG